ncbi:hypothetical protein G4923_09885 [Aeromonas rivipollensis]|uniref:Uncharacterized protein n=1 Tax=Aeromonas rivipollensis TaxID=948519 RepID=A0ABX0CYG9_9GAMM|nr:hypothetical protein [Aeromonas rivipollensis]NEX89011.1 hypothetical protein [Aeromonas rivipollensis]NEY04877.1 hypothetical protein [Aeromonas rivipollensis]
MVQDLLKSWFSDNKVKITSPVLGAFIGAWAIFNWKHFLLLFWGGGTLEVRLIAFENILTFENLSVWLWPFLVALLYAFGLPYLNVVSHKILKKAEEWRHIEIVNIDIIKARKKAELNEELYKADPANPYIGRKLEAELKQKDAEAEKIRTDADKAKAELKEANAKQEKSELEAKELKLIVDEVQRKNEREQQAHEIAKAKHHQELVDLHFPTLYLFLDVLSKSLREDGLHISLGLMAESISVSFGYEDVESLLMDNDFTLHKLGGVSFVVYDGNTLLSDLKNIIEKHKENINEGVLFDHLVSTFELLDRFRFISSELKEDVAKDFLDDSSNIFDLVSDDGVNSVIAETNAHSFGVEYAEFISIRNAKDGSIVVDASAEIQGETDEDRPYSGHKISVSFELIYKPIIGRNGYGIPEFGEVRATLEDYS